MKPLVTQKRKTRAGVTVDLKWLLVAFFVFSYLSNTTFAAKKKYWNLSPYRIQLFISADSRALPEPFLGEKLLESLQEQIFSTLFPLWSVEYELTTGPAKHRLQQGLDQLEAREIEIPEEEMAEVYDKKLFLSVRATATGYSLECREYDCYVHRWGSVRSRSVRQRSILAEQCFDLLTKTFAPLATVRSMEDDTTRVKLEFKGSDLPRQSNEVLLLQSKDVFEPLLVRTDSSGEVRAEGVRNVPWTYLTLEEDEEEQWLGLVHSGIRTPFGLRRRGRTQHLAIASRHQLATSSIRFHPRHDANQGLSGYEVFRKESENADSQLLGLTNANGEIEVPPGSSPVTTLYLRSDGQLLAKIPVAPGAKPLQEVPVADDPARLRAQAELISLREQLIDLVARRSIMMRRVRNHLKQGNFDQAEEIFSVLDSLPGRAQFDDKISIAKNNKLFRSEDARIQGKIDKLFAEVQKLLGGFLNIGELTELKREIATAKGRQS